MEHPAVLRQYYGCDLLPAPTISNGKKIMNRYSYAVSVCTTSVDTDPAQFVIKKMHPTMDLISKDPYKLLINNVEYFNITSVDLSHQSSHCTMLIYYADGSLKRSSSIGFHCDCTYFSNDSSFSSSHNTQVKNTSAISVSLGSSRSLPWKRRSMYNKDISSIGLMIKHLNMCLYWIITILPS